MCDFILKTCSFLGTSHPADTDKSLCDYFNQLKLFFAISIASSASATIVADILSRSPQDHMSFWSETALRSSAVGKVSMSRYQRALSQQKVHSPRFKNFRIALPLLAATSSNSCTNRGASGSQKDANRIPRKILCGGTKFKSSVTSGRLS